MLEFAVAAAESSGRIARRYFRSGLEVKSKSDIEHDPFTEAATSGEVTAVNSDLGSKPEQINQSPHDAWMIALKLSNATEAEALDRTGADTSHLLGQGWARGRNFPGRPRKPTAEYFVRGTEPQQTFGVPFLPQGLRSLPHAMMMLIPEPWVANPQMDHFSLLGIAFEAGFKSKSTFNKYFKELTGLSPSEYREQLFSQMSSVS